MNTKTIVKGYTRRKHGRATHGGKVRGHLRTSNLLSNNAPYIDKVLVGLVSQYLRTDTGRYLSWDELSQQEKSEVLSALQKHNYTLADFILERNELERMGI